MSDLGVCMEDIMADETAVTGITIKMGDVEVTLTPKQLKSLRDALDELFPKSTVVKEHHYPYWRRWWDYTYTIPCSTETTRWNYTADNTKYILTLAEGS